MIVRVKSSRSALVRQDLSSFEFEFFGGNFSAWYWEFFLVLGVPLVPLRPVVSVVGLSTGNFSQWIPIKPGPPEQGLMGKNPTLINYTTTGI